MQSFSVAGKPAVLWAVKAEANQSGANHKGRTARGPQLCHVCGPPV